MNSTWDDVQRKARLLENEIDVKLISLNKINSSNGTGYNSQQQKVFTGKNALFESLTAEIEEQISKLTKINDEMRQYVENGSSEYSKTSLHHIVHRHREILRDYCSEFNRSCVNIQNQIKREELMGNTDSSSGDFDSSLNNRGGKSTDFLLRENEGINSCDRILNEQISIAMSLKENLYTQSSGLGSIDRKINQLLRKYPALNNVMQKIRVKKRKDTLILAAVISSCLIFLIIYIMH